jgi:hypothetical protein
MSDLLLNRYIKLVSARVRDLLVWPEVQLRASKTYYLHSVFEYTDWDSEV